jgi:hypothetical protein
MLPNETMTENNLQDKGRVPSMVVLPIEGQGYRGYDNTSNWTGTKVRQEFQGLNNGYTH